MSLLIVNHSFECRTVHIKFECCMKFNLKYKFNNRLLQPYWMPLRINRSWFIDSCLVIFPEPIIFLESILNQSKCLRNDKYSSQPAILRNINMWQRFFALFPPSCALIHSALCVYAFSPEWWRFPFHWTTTTTTTTDDVTFPLFSWRCALEGLKWLVVFDALSRVHIFSTQVQISLRCPTLMLMPAYLLCSSPCCISIESKQTSERPPLSPLIFASDQRDGWWCGVRLPEMICVNACRDRTRSYSGGNLDAS